MNPSTTNYYKPTTFLQKINKVLRLYYLSVVTPRSTAGSSARVLSVLMFVPEVDRTGGYETQALQLAASLAAQQSVVCIVGSSSYGAGPAKELRGGFELRRISTGRGSFVRIAWSVCAFLMSRRLAYQVVHLHGVTGFTLFAARIARLLRLPIIIKPATHGDIHAITKPSKLQAKLYPKWLHSADRFVAVSGQISQELQEASIDSHRIVHLPNFVDPERFHPASVDTRQSLRKRYDVSISTMLFLYLGRLERRKGVEYLLQAWKSMTTGVLWIVGDGPERAALEAMARELKLQRITFWGATETPLSYYQSADVFVFPSLREGSPNALLEAMSCGLACVATRIGGVTDIIDDGKNGLLVDAGAPEALEQAMSHLSGDPQSASTLGIAARAKVENHFHIDHVTQKYIELYRELLK